MDLRLTIELVTIPLLGFDRERWERRKAEWRTRRTKDLAVSPRTVKSWNQIEAENLDYWTGDQSPLRAKFAEEAEKAHQRWNKVAASLKRLEASTRRPLEGPHSRISPKCDMSEGHDSGPPLSVTFAGHACR